MQPIRTLKALEIKRGINEIVLVSLSIFKVFYS